MSQSLTQCRLEVNPTLNSSDRLLLGEIIVREIRRRTRAGQSFTGSRFVRYSTAYSRLIQRRGLSTNVDLDRSGQMLASLRVLSHGQGFIVVGISSMDRAAFAKARYTQGQGRGPARRWLGISQSFLRRQERLIRQAGDEFLPRDLRDITESDLPDPSALIDPETGEPIPLSGPAFRQGTSRSTTIDISPEADRTTVQRLVGEDPDRAGLTPRSRRQLVDQTLRIDGLNQADRRAIRREEARLNRRDRLDRTGALEVEALRFVRESSELSGQLPTFSRSLDRSITTLQGRSAPSAQVQRISAPIIVTTPRVALTAEDTRIQAEVDLNARHNILNQIDGFENIQILPLMGEPPGQTIPLATRVIEEPTVGVDIDQAQRGVNRIFNPNANNEGRDQTSLRVKRFRQEQIEAQRNALIRRQQTELARIEQQESRDRPDVVESLGTGTVEDQIKRIRRIRRGNN